MQACIWKFYEQNHVKLILHLSNHANGRPNMNKTAKGITYVSVWVMIWGTIASLVDFALLGADLYDNGSLGQASTFASYGLAAIVVAWKLAPKFLNEKD